MTKSPLLNRSGPSQGDPVYDDIFLSCTFQGTEKCKSLSIGNKMIRYVGDNLTKITKTGHEVFGQQLYIDIHCHCLPCIDDGPATISDSLALCRALVKDGIAKVIATPHQLGRFNGYNDASQIRNAVFTLNENLKSSDISLTVVAGADVRVDERIYQLLEADEILTLADSGKYILLELPHEVFIDVEPLLVELISLGIQAIISHPERNTFLAKQPKILLKWLKHSAHLQITAGSLLGDFGVIAQKAAWQFLSSGLASVVATDAHDLDIRRPCMNIAFERISTILGGKIARLVCIENPLRVFNGHDLQTVHSYGIRKYIYETVPSSF